MRDFNEVLRREEQFDPNPREMAQINLFRERVCVCGCVPAFLFGVRGLDWTFERTIEGGYFCRVPDRDLASPDLVQLISLSISGASKFHQI